MFPRAKNRSKRFSWNNAQQGEATRIEGKKAKAKESELSSQTIKQNSISINPGRTIWSVAFSDREHIVGGDNGGKVRCWRVEDGNATETAMDAQSAVECMAVSQGGKWIVTGTHTGQVIVWDVDSRKKVIEFKAHVDAVRAVDVSPDATKLSTGSYDCTARVWSSSTSQCLLILRQKDPIRTAEFSPDGRILAIGSADVFNGNGSLRIYDSQQGHQLAEFRIPSWSVAWSRDSRHLFAMSRDGNIYFLDVSSKTVHSKWPIHDNNEPRCICLSRNGTFIAASANSSVSLWDASTHQQIGSVICHPDIICSMAISADHKLVIGGGKKITLWNLCDTLSAPYVDNHEELKNRFNAAEARLKQTIEELRSQLADTKRVAKEKEDKLGKAIQSLCASLAMQTRKSVELEKTVEELRTLLEQKT